MDRFYFNFSKFILTEMRGEGVDELMQPGCKVYNIHHDLQAVKYGSQDVCKHQI